MVGTEVKDGYLEEKEHQASYIFDPSNEAEDAGRPSKRRKLSKKSAKDGPAVTPSHSSFRALFDGAEAKELVDLRQQLFESSWARIDKRIQSILREGNQSTLEEVLSFVQEVAGAETDSRIPAAFIITGPDIASQDLLFEQLSETLRQSAEANVVRLRSADATNLKATLKKVIHLATSRLSQDETDQDLAVSKDGRKYLNYDLEAINAYLKSYPNRRLVVAFEDSEAFDSGILSELISLLSSWLDRIPFTLLFGVATSVELFQARLPKSTCQKLYGDQFDVEQAGSIVARIFKAAAAHLDTPMRLGPSLLLSLLDRQHDQVAGIPFLVNSLKYAYMCHFYSNPLSVLFSPEQAQATLKAEHLEAIRNLPSFQAWVEQSIDDNELENARKLLGDDEYLTSSIQERSAKTKQWVDSLLKAVSILSAHKTDKANFTQLYIDAFENGVNLKEHNSQFADTIRRMPPSELTDFMTAAVAIIQQGDQALGLPSWADEDKETFDLLRQALDETKTLVDQAEENGNQLRSKYSGQSKVLRTTVVAQKVQLSRDTAALTDEDKAYTELVDRVLGRLEAVLSFSRAEDLPLHEAWLYDSRAPYKDVFIPRPRGVMERALARPHDYLSCSCCKSDGDQIKATLPFTSILYQLYLETGSLINIADLWSAFYAVIGEENEDGLDERTALVQFYRALAELRIMGFVKPSRKKVDHVAKLAWRGL